MSLTKSTSETEVGTIRDYGYEEWSDGLPSLTEEDLIAMAAEDYERRRFDAESYDNLHA